MNVTFNEGFQSSQHTLLPRFYQWQKCYYFSHWNLSPSLCFVHSLVPYFLPISVSQSAGFSSEPPARPFSLHLGAWLPKQMGLRGEEKLKVKQQPKRSSTPSLPLRIAGVQATEGIPTDKTATDFSMTLKHNPGRMLLPAQSAYYQTPPIIFSGTHSRTSRTYLDGKVSKQCSSFLNGCIR